MKYDLNSSVLTCASLEGKRCMKFAVKIVLCDVIMISLQQQGWYKFQNCLTVPSKNLIVKVSNRNTRKICDDVDFNDVTLVSLLLTLNIF